MSYRNHLPQLDGALFLTDGGIETVLIFHEGLDLPAFAAFDLLKDAAGADTLRRYYDPYATLAREHGLGLRAREPDLASEPALGGRARLHRRRARGVEPPRDRADGGDPRRARDGGADRDQRLHRAARRRLPAGGDAVGRGGAGVPRDADRDVRRHRGGHGHRDHDDLRRGGDRHRPRRARGRHPGRRSRSRSRPTGGCRAARRWATRSNRSTRRPARRPPTT